MSTLESAFRIQVPFTVTEVDFATSELSMEPVHVAVLTTETVAVPYPSVLTVPV